MHGSGTMLDICAAYIRKIYKVGTLVGFDIELPCVVVNTRVPFISRHLALDNRTASGHWVLPERIVNRPQLLAAGCFQMRRLRRSGSWFEN